MESAMSSPHHIPDELLPYKHRLSPRFFELRAKLLEFSVSTVLAQRETYREQRELEIAKVGGDALRAAQPPVLREMQLAAQKAGLWNFFLPEVSKLSVLEYAPLAEIMGSIPLLSLVTNCAAPDSGNMEVLEKFGSMEQKKKYLEPLLKGEIRSCFVMTEPGVASSDATQIATTITRDPNGRGYLVNGHKFFITGALRPECKIALVLGVSPNLEASSNATRHNRQSMIIVPMDAPGVKILRVMHVFGHPHDHVEMIFDNVLVPAENMILGEGRGFEIAQGRLGPGRIHHCMRVLGVAESALQALIHRAKTRFAFGSRLSSKDGVRRSVADARMQISAARGLCYLAAVIADERGFKEARQYIAMIKVAAPRACLAVIDEAIQVHGAAGVAQDSSLAEMYMQVRTLRLADGPDAVHMNTIADVEINKPVGAIGKRVSGENPYVDQYGFFKEANERNERLEAERKRKRAGKL